MWSSLFSFFSGYAGKALVLGCVFLAFLVLKLRLDTAQARLKQSRLEVSVLQAANQKQYAAIQTLLENQQKQNELITAYEQAKREAENSLAKQKKSLKNLSDTESTAWKKQELPKTIRLLLTRE